MKTKPENPIQAWRSVRYFWHHASRYPLHFWGMILTVPIAILFNEFLPALITADILKRLASGDFTRGDLWGSFGPQILLTVGMMAFGGIVVWRVNAFLNWRLEGFVVRDMFREVFDHLMRLDANFHANHFGGSLVSQANKLTGAYVRTTDTTLFQTSGLFWSLLFTSVLLWNRARLFVLLLLLLAVVYIVCAVLVTRRVRYYSGQEADASNKITGQLADSITNVLAVKGFAALQSENKRFGNTVELWRGSLLRYLGVTLRAQGVFSSIAAIMNALAITMAVASVVIFGADVAIVFLVFTFAIGIRDKLWEFSGQALRNYNRAFGDAQSMLDILNTDPEVQDPAQPEKPRIKAGAVSFKNMNFAHADSHANEALFANLNLDIASGEKIGLVGHSGSGKTTLTKLLLRFNDIDDGTILIDGQNTAHLTQDDLRRHIAYVPQEPLLFHRSIRENIAYGKPNATDKAVRAAAQKAYADEFIAKLPKGYDTLVGERGVKLSGGQRQRIAIARAILKDAPILVLDEATSALDSESEKLIQAALWELMEGRTAIVIAHRLSTIQKMDRIVVLESGTIVEQGTHRELLTAQGVYAKLWSHQSGGFIEE